MDRRGVLTTFVAGLSVGGMAAFYYSRKRVARADTALHAATSDCEPPDGSRAYERAVFRPHTFLGIIFFGTRGGRDHRRRLAFFRAWAIYYTPNQPQPRPSRPPLLPPDLPRPAAAVPALAQAVSLWAACSPVQQPGGGPPEPFYFILIDYSK